MATESDGNRNVIPWKLRGQVAYGLIRDLAAGTDSQARLARKYDVTVATINAFKKRNAERIAAVAADLDNVMAGLWVAHKQRRIAEYEQDIALLNDSIEAQEAYIRDLTERIEAGEVENASRLARADRDLGAMMKRKHAALRGVAEELGQLPNRVTLQVQGGESPVLHQIVGVDPDEV